MQASIVVVVLVVTQRSYPAVTDVVHKRDTDAANDEDEDGAGSTQHNKRVVIGET